MGAPEEVRVTGVHHVAYVVARLDEALPDFARRLGATLELRETMDAQGVEAAMLRVGADRIELIEPLDEDGPVARFLVSRGEGLHHVAYAVADLVGALATLAAQGAELIDEKPRPGLGGHPVAFVHPRSGYGALTELVQSEPPRAM